MSANLLVTGAAGFIGRNLVEALNSRGEDRLLLVDHLGSSDKWRNLVGLRFDDYMERDAFRVCLQSGRLDKMATVFHLGACSATTEKDASYLADNNFRFTRELCEWALSRGARFIYASSAATYGDGSRGYSDEDENTPFLRPLNMYGFSKQLFDLWALRRGLLNRIAGLKYFNVYGPGEAHKGPMRSMVHKAWGQVRDTGQIRLFRSDREDVGDGEQRRDFIAVKDAVLQTLFYHDRPDVSGLFNCGTGKARTWNDLARAVFAAMGCPPVIEYIPLPDALRGSYQYYTQADMRKARAAGWTAEPDTLEEGVADYLRGPLSPPPPGAHPA